MLSKYGNREIERYNEILNFRIEDNWNQFYERVYYQVVFKNGTEVILFNEVSNSYFFDEATEEEFQQIKNTEEFFSELEENEFLSDFMNEKSYRCPKYVYFTFLNIDEQFKLLFKENLEKEIEGYTKQDFYNDEIEKINSFYAYVSDNENAKIL